MTKIEEAARAVTLHDTLEHRASCRAFLPTQVPQPILDAILASAQLTASWCNSQPWQVILTRGEATERFREGLYENAKLNPQPDSDLPFPERYVGIYKERQRECGWQLYGSLGIAFGDREASGRQVLENFRFFGAPHVAIITSERDLGVYGVLDCGGYVTNFLNAAHSYGVATVPQAALAMHGGFIRDFFSIPANRLILCGISLGYADSDHPANAFRTNRAAISDVVQVVD